MADTALIAALNAQFTALAGDGVDELVVRVAQYDFTGGVQTPSQWQAIARFRNRGKAWGVALAETPGEAVLGAFRSAAALHHPQNREAPLTPRVRTRTRTIT